MARKSPAQVLEKPVLEEEDTPANSVVSQSHTETTIVEERIRETELSQPDIQPQPNDDVRLKFEVEVDAFNSKLSTALLAVPIKPTHPSLSNVLLTAQHFIILRYYPRYKTATTGKNFIHHNCGYGAGSF